MDDRVRLAIGGTAVVATSVAVVLAVALSNAAALTDAAGTPSGVAAVVVPPVTITATPSPSEPIVATAPPVAPVVVEEPEPPTVDAVTVPAPEPVVVSGAADAVATTREEDSFINDCATTGSWQAAREWANARGWKDAKVEAWLSRLQVKLDRMNAERFAHRDGGGSYGEWNGPDNTDSSDDESTWPGRTSSQTPARSGAPARSDSSDDGSKRDRSRVSPERRDR